MYIYHITSYSISYTRAGVRSILGVSPALLRALAERVSLSQARAPTAVPMPRRTAVGWRSRPGLRKCHHDSINKDNSDNTRCYRCPSNHCFYECTIGHAGAECQSFITTMITTRANMMCTRHHHCRTPGAKGVLDPLARAFHTAFFLRRFLYTNVSERKHHMNA